jgi:cytochrome P450
MQDAAQEINFFDEETNNCPYPAYQVMRDEIPVWKDPSTGFFVLTRYDDIRAAVLDPKRFTNRPGSTAGTTEKALKTEGLDPERAKLMLDAAEQGEELRQLYEERGWVTAETLDGLDEPEHMQRRRLLEYAFRPAQIKALDPFIEELANRLLDGFMEDGRCDWVSQFAIPLPNYVIGRQMGVPEADMPMVQKWTEAWVQRLGLMQTPAERRWSAEQEIEAQHYFQAIFERLRENPDGSVLSDIVNTEIPEWGRPMNDNELHSELMADFWVGGSETTRNSISGGMRLLIENPDLWDEVSSDPEKHLPALVEEILRLEAPVGGLLRETAVDVELHGVTIPAGSTVIVRFAAGNRDERHFECPAEVKLDRPRPKSHLTFSTGSHHCLGAHLARAEIYYVFKVLMERVERVWYIEDANDFSYHSNYFLRALKELHIGFTPK